MKRKFFGKMCGTLLACCLVVGSGAVMVSCGGKGNQSETQDTGSEEKVGVTLDKTTATVECYETVTVNATAEGEVTWTSSDPTVATVEGGVISALKVGTATVTATCGEETATCVVTVTETTVVPVLELNETEIALFETGEEFTLTATPTWKNEPFTENVEYTWAFGADEATDVATFTPNGATATVKGVKAGKTKITVSTVIRGKTAMETVEITVKESVLSLDLATNDQITVSTGDGEEGYNASLTTLETTTTANETELDLQIGFGADDVTDEATVNWSVTDGTVAKVEDGKIVALKVGETDITASVSYTSATAGEKTGTVTVHVVVDRAEFELADTFTVETTNLKTLTLTNALEGDVEKMFLHEKDILSGYADKVITLNSANLPKTTADGLGDNLEAVIQTTKANYTLKMNVYTKIISSKADLDSMGTLAAAVSNDAAGGIPTTWDGYFVLDQDIEYNGEYMSLFGKGNKWNTNGDINVIDKRGFKGVFDGKGHNINGMTISKNTYQDQSWGFIPAMLAGSEIKNVSFTNARAVESNFLSAYFCGKIENVLIQFAELQSGANERNYAGLVGAEKNGPNNMNAYLTNVIVDASQAKLTGEHFAMVVEGKNYSTGKIVLDNVYVIMKGEDNGKVKKYATVQEMQQDTEVATALETLDTEIWTVKNGMPIFINLYDGTALEIVGSPATQVNVGDEIELGFNKNFVDVTITKQDGSASILTYENGKIVIPDEISAAGNFILNAKYIYGNDTETFEFSVKYVKNTTMNEIVDFAFGTDGQSALTNVTFDLSDIAENLGTVQEFKLGDTDISSTATLTGATATLPLSLFNNGKTYGDVVITLKSKLGEAEFSTVINAKLVTKVISTKADLDNMGTIAAKFSNDYASGIPTTWDGYFMLGANIEYNGVYIGMFGNTKSNWLGVGGIDNTSTRGFKGVFDGAGHYIDGMEINRTGTNGCGYGFIPTLQATAVIKDVAFINASVNNCAYISSNGTAGTLLSNIYVQYKSFVANDQNTTTFFPTSRPAVTAQYIFIDGSKLETFTRGTSAKAGIMDYDCGAQFFNQKCWGVVNEKAQNADGSIATTDHKKMIAPSMEAYTSDASDWWNMKNKFGDWSTDFWTIVPMNKGAYPIPKCVANK